MTKIVRHVRHCVIRKRPASDGGDDAMTQMTQTMGPHDEATERRSAARQQFQQEFNQSPFCD